MNAISPYFPYIFQGLIVTLQLTVLGCLVYIPAAFILGLARSSPSRFLSWPAAWIVEFFRGTSAIVQLFWAYFVLPFFGIHLSAMVTAVTVLGLNEGSYTSEAVRAAFASIPKGQREASIALNFSPLQRIFRILLPQAIPIMIPSFGNATISLLKFTTLASLVTVSEFTFRIQTVRASIGQTNTLFTLALAVYLAAALGIALIFLVLERVVSRAIIGGAPRTPWRLRVARQFGMQQGEA